MTHEAEHHHTLCNQGARASPVPGRQGRLLRTGCREPVPEARRRPSRGIRTSPSRTEAWIADELALEPYLATCPSEFQSRRPTGRLRDAERAGHLPVELAGGPTASRPTASRAPMGPSTSRCSSCSSMRRRARSRTAPDATSIPARGGRIVGRWTQPRLPPVVRLDPNSRAPDRLAENRSRFASRRVSGWRGPPTHVVGHPDAPVRRAPRGDRGAGSRGNRPPRHREALVALAADTAYLDRWVRGLGGERDRPIHAPERGPRLMLVHRFEGQMGAVHDDRVWVALATCDGPRDTSPLRAPGGVVRVSDARRGDLVAPREAVTLLPEDIHDHGHVLAVATRRTA